jgi:hypothetical protein
MTSVHVHIYSITHGTLAAILSNRLPTFSILVSLPTNKQTNYELKNIYTHSRDEYFY